MATALLSVSNKAGIVRFAEELLALGFKLIGSDGTAREVSKTSKSIRNVAEIVGGGPILGHRVVTLSRQIHACLLARPEDKDELTKLGLEPIDLVCADLYPLEAEIEKPGSTLASVIEMTDIGGPTILRSAAKGRRIIVCDQEDRDFVIPWLKAGKPDEENVLRRMAAKAEFIAGKYALLSARYQGLGEYDGFIGRRTIMCAYGENRWQDEAAFFSVDQSDPLAIDKFEKISGMDPGFVNLTDLDRALQTMTHIAAAFSVNRNVAPFVAVGCKHGNCCGAGIGLSPAQSIKSMIMGDPLSLFGGFVMTNFFIHASEAELLRDYQGKRVLDGVAAPDFSDEALGKLYRASERCRLFKNPALGSLTVDSLSTVPVFKSVRGGFVRQPNYTFVLNLNDSALTRNMSSLLALNRQDDMLLAWAVGSTSNSNTITLAKNGMIIGNATGQQDRVGACELAIAKARRGGHDLNDAVAYSDSFFPFTDGPQKLHEAGVTAIFASSGSVNDEKVRDFCREHDMTLWTMPDAHCRGFFGH